MAKRILVFEPYFGGSHKQFLEELTSQLDCDIVWFTLPARKWKMRMQLSAYWLTKQVENMVEDDRCFDVVFCSTFVDLAVLRQQLSCLPGWNHRAKFFVYFHENQFAYPQHIDQATSMHQFTAINFNSAMAADKIGFNSEFNRQTLLTGCRKLLKMASDMRITDCLERIIAKSRVIYPGIDFSFADASVPERKNDVPVIVWNHRWEYDKGPEEFFKTLNELKNEGVKFKLIVLGQNFMRQPECFEKARVELKEETVYFDYAESREEYYSLLRQGDIVVSTSLHEFYGISVIEAVRCGCEPLLPNRLSYPELFPPKYLYAEEDLKNKLRKMLEIHQQERVSLDQYSLTEKFSWDVLANTYQQWITEG